MNFNDILSSIFEDKKPFNSVDNNNVGYFPRNVSFGDNNSKCLLLSGDNASGKSLLVRFLSIYCEKNEMRNIEVSMGDRTKKGYMRQAINYGRYGDEGAESTGYTTLNRLIKDIERLKKADYPYMLFLDEPDVGLSESYHNALGQFIAENINELNKNDLCKGIVVVSHTKRLFKSLLANIEIFPSKINVGCNEKSFDTWLNGEVKNKSVEDLLNLPKFAKSQRKRFKECKESNTN